MAIDVHQWRSILSADVNGRCLSAGYPDLLVDRAGIPLGEEWCIPRACSADLAAYHGWKRPIFDSRRVFEGLGLDLMVIDRGGANCDRTVDLNMAVEWGGELYDLVIDPGTIEHCFNIAQAAITLASAVADGGYISQAVPMSMFNHGYYNLNPVWFHDFYTRNGFDIRQLSIRIGEGITSDFDPTMRMGTVPDNAVILCLARRVTLQPLRYPQQDC